jgi:hypothetical protein
MANNKPRGDGLKLEKGRSIGALFRSGIGILPMRR